MYTITDMGNGQFWCEGKLQDGTERWVKSSLEEAVQSMKTFAKTMNGTKLKKKHIAYLRPVEPKYEQYYPYGKPKKG
jgi:hypothetical protein